MRLADQIANALAVIAEIQRCRGRTFPAHLVKQTCQQHIIAFAEAAVVVDQKLGHDEQRDTFDPGWRIWQFRQHQVHDIFRQRMIAPGNEYLVAAQPIRTVICRFGACADV